MIFVLSGVVAAGEESFSFFFVEVSAEETGGSAASVEGGAVMALRLFLDRSSLSLCEERKGRNGQGAKRRAESC